MSTYERKIDLQHCITPLFYDTRSLPNKMLTNIQLASTAIILTQELLAFLLLHLTLISLVLGLKFLWLLLFCRKRMLSEAVIKRIKYGTQRINARKRSNVCQHKIWYPVVGWLKLCLYCRINLREVAIVC